MFSFAKRSALAALVALATGSAFAADLPEPPVVEAPPVYEAPSYGGWYIRGDVDYHWSKFRGADYITYGVCVDPCGVPRPLPGRKSFDFGDLKGAFSLGGGVGYQATKHFRADLTADYFADSDFRGQTSDAFSVSVDTSSYSAMLLLANAYADLGTWHGITPYVGAGIGGAYVKWDHLRNVIEPGIDNRHKGSKNWRFAYSVAAGASYCLTRKVNLDLGYRYARIEGGKMFDERSTTGVSLGAGPGYDRGIDTHEVRGGLRYYFGGNNNCSEPEPIAYEPSPVYKQ